MTRQTFDSFRSSSSQYESLQPQTGFHTSGSYLVNLGKDTTTSYECTRIPMYEVIFPLFTNSHNESNTTRLILPTRFKVVHNEPPLHN